MINIITVDGPAGVGKGTICKLLSKNLDSKILNSGKIFRTLAYYLKKNNKFYSNLGYLKLGHIYFRDQSDMPFNCYEKLLK